MTTDKKILQIHKVTNANMWREFQWKVINKFFRTPHVPTDLQEIMQGTICRSLALVHLMCIFEFSQQLSVAAFQYSDTRI